MTRGFWTAVVVCLAACTLVACGNGGGGKPVCGNGVLEEGEQCDGTDLGGESCTGFGHAGGNLACTAECTFDQTGCTDCGNGTKDQGEDCDGADLGGASCTSLGHEGGDLACSNDCTFDESTCHDCGNGTREPGEDCDGTDLGGATCASQGHDGGDLACSADCTFDESACHDCGTDPCEGITCSGHGHCIVTDCQAYCVCEEGYAPGPDNACVSADYCNDMGQSCSQDDQCCSVYCLKNEGADTGYCSFQGCTHDEFCQNHADDGRGMCCIEGPDGAMCVKIAEGATCGDRTGTCGESCAGVLDSGCQQGTSCTAYHMSDPNAYCAASCATSDDCLDCSDISDPDREFLCYDIGPDESLCMKRPDECDRSADCPQNEACGFWYADDAFGIESRCRDAGAKESGETCDASADVYATPYQERCKSNLCLDDHCSQICMTDDDCPDHMQCYGATQCTDMSCSEYTYYGLCRWMDGSLASCGSNADCPDGEYCQHYDPLDGDIVKMCVTENCDPEGDDCLLPGEECGEGLPPCWGNYCLTRNDGYSFCRAMCETNDDCGDMLCGNWPQPSGEMIGVCTYIPGTNGDECSSNSDCQGEETCQYYSLHEGLNSLCATPGQGGGEVGDACQSSSACASNLCFNFGCTAICEADADCPDGYLCGAFNFQGFEQTTTACMPFAGSGQDCVNDASCPQGESCTFFRRPGEMDAMCVTTIDPAGQPGDECGYGLPPCYNGLCINDGIDAWCGSVCQTDAECPDGHLCGMLVGGPDASTSGIGACIQFGGSMAPCTNNADCTAADEICGFHGPAEGPMVGRCRPEVPGGVDPGEECSQSAECRNRVCLQEFGVCTAYCETNADCAAYGMECVNAWWYEVWGQPWGGRGCVPPGADAPYCSLCSSDADCVGDEARCIESLANPGERYCGKPCAGEEDCPAGASCVDVGDGTMNCRPDSDTCVPG